MTQLEFVGGFIDANAERITAPLPPAVPTY